MGSKAKLRIKRTYEPKARGDGRRFLVERLWPRGIRKEALALDAWLKDVAPSTGLRQWFGHRVERWEDFQVRYRRELDGNPEAWQPILDAARRGPVTLLYSARDEAHNGAVVLRDYLQKKAPRTVSPKTARTARQATPRKCARRGSRRSGSARA